MRQRLSVRDAVVAAVAALLAVGAVALLVGPLRGTGVADDAFRLPWWALAPVFTLTELVVASVQLRRETLAISLPRGSPVLGPGFCPPPGILPPPGPRPAPGLGRPPAPPPKPPL